MSSKKSSSKNSSGSELKITELKNRGRVSTRSGTQGSTSAAETRDAIDKLEDAIRHLKHDEKTEKVVRAFNKVCACLLRMLAAHACCACLLRMRAGITAPQADLWLTLPLSFALCPDSRITLR